MRLYRVHFLIDHGSSAGFSWHSSKSGALRAAREAFKDDPAEYELEGFPTIEEVQVEMCKEGVLAALNRYANHPDNG
jgi:predicted secreted protein